MRGSADKQDVSRDVAPTLGRLTVWRRAAHPLQDTVGQLFEAGTKEAQKRRPRTFWHKNFSGGSYIQRALQFPNRQRLLLRGPGSGGGTLCRQEDLRPSSRGSLGCRH